MTPEVPERRGQLPPALLTRGQGGQYCPPLAFHRDSNKVKRLLYNIGKISLVSVSLSLSAVIPASVGFDSSY